MPIHIRPTAQLADRALLPTDPGVALALAQALVDAPRMFNHNHGLWGYIGSAADGAGLTIQSTGIGGPSAAIVLDELIGLGLRRAVRLGTCTVVRTADDVPGAVAGLALELGDLVIVERAVCGDGTSRALGGGPVVAADGELTGALGLASPAIRQGLVASTDVGADAGAGAGAGAGVRVGTGTAAAESGATRAVLAHDMETAALLRLGAVRGVAIACVLVVADLVVDGQPQRIDDEALAGAYEQAGRLALSGLAARPS